MPGEPITLDQLLAWCEEFDNLPTEGWLLQILDGTISIDAFTRAVRDNVAPQISTTRGALRLIRQARDHRAEHGRYPAAPHGPGEDQDFDDWAADIADGALRGSGS